MGTTYLLRDIDPETWAKVKARAGREGHSLRWVLLKLIRAYADERVFCW
jgi:hypothetical protein